jgi:deoxyribodipyrimidine photo-lyase
MATLFWFRRDLRLADNIALNAAISASSKGQVIPVYAMSKDSFEQLEGIRQHSVYESLVALSQSLGGNLSVRDDAAWVALPKLAADQGMTKVFATRAFDPDGVAEQNRVGEALAQLSISLELHDSYYAVLPGTVAKPDLTPYRVYTPFFRAWREVGWQNPVELTSGAIWMKIGPGPEALTPTKPAPFKVKAGEAYALRTWGRFKKRALYSYDEMRNRADQSGTSHLSHALAFGEIHPRTLLAELAEVPGHEVFRKEIAWREFYADVLWHNPHTTTEYYEPRFAQMRYDSGDLADERLVSWQQGKTGYPMVDAGMRQLLETGWMHNRVRMIVASFLVKDLHIEWQHGASWFERHLSDFDPASNAHGWQWTAGCGTDASPYFRVFNPVLQGYKFDPNGDYVRRYIPELAHISGPEVHEPWTLIDGLAGGYVAPIVDHSQERDEALRRLEEIKR